MRRRRNPYSEAIYPALVAAADGPLRAWLQARAADVDRVIGEATDDLLLGTQTLGEQADRVKAKVEAAIPENNTGGYKISIEQGVGYSGKRGAKAYVAKITGTSDRYGLQRTFVEPDRVERDSFTKAKYTRTLHFDLGVGLYEISEGGERWFRIVFMKDGKIVSSKIDSARAEAIAKLMTDGVEFNAARLATKPPPVA